MIVFLVATILLSILAIITTYKIAFTEYDKNTIYMLLFIISILATILLGDMLISIILAIK